MREAHITPTVQGAGVRLELCSQLLGVQGARGTSHLFASLVDMLLPLKHDHPFREATGALQYKRAKRQCVFNCLWWYL